MRLHKLWVDQIMNESNHIKSDQPIFYMNDQINSHKSFMEKTYIILNN